MDSWDDLGRLVDLGRPSGARLVDLGRFSGTRAPGTGSVSSTLLDTNKNELSHF